jgi:hypothetical protein
MSQNLPLGRKCAHRYVFQALTEQTFHIALFSGLYYFPSLEFRNKNMKFTPHPRNIKLNIRNENIDKN